MSSQSEANTKQKRPRARPTKYKPEYCQLIVEAGERGDSFLEFACQIGVVTDTLREWKSKYPDFSVAYDRAKDLSEKHFMKIGRLGMRGHKSKEMPGFNAAVWMFWMKAKYKWRDDPEPEVDDSDVTFT